VFVRTSPVRSSNFRSPKKSGRYFYVKWLIISQNVSRSSSGVFLKVFCFTLFQDRSPPSNFPGLPRTFTIFCGNYARSSHFRPWKVLFLLFLKFSFFVIFSLIANFCLKYYLLCSKMISPGIISTKTSKSPGKSSEVRTAFWRTLIIIS